MPRVPDRTPLPAGARGRDRSSADAVPPNAARTCSQVSGPQNRSDASPGGSSHLGECFPSRAREAIRERRHPMPALKLACIELSARYY
jgi:hypothetical protein